MLSGNKVRASKDRDVRSESSESSPESSESESGGWQQLVALQSVRQVPPARFWRPKPLLHESVSLLPPYLTEGLLQFIWL